MALSWYGKRFGPGDIDGTGTLRLLGTPNINMAATLVRETAQNSWDARIPGRQLRYSVHLRTLSESAVKALRKSVFAEVGDGTTLSDTLSRDEIPVIEIVDRGTHGLGGPLRNDIALAEEEPTDFIDFVLTIGARQDKANGAGTYGFGKTISYLSSSCHTMLIWSRCHYKGRLESRLIGSAMGEPFDRKGKRYTGRQWWGDVKEDRIEPARGRSAEALAGRIFQEGFEADETGTSLLILDPVIADSVDGAKALCVDSILWHLWPKLIPHPLTGDLPMDVRMTCEGVPVVVPDPALHPVLRGFVEALNAVRVEQDGTGASPSRQSDLTTIEPIEIYRPRDVLGHLAITRVPTRSAEQADEVEIDGDGLAVEPNDPVAPFSGPARHVALMRHDAELVVTYVRFPAGVSDAVHACGVFRCSKHLDPLFAAAEPPAHDLWEPSAISDRTSRSRVNTTLKRLPQAWARQLGSDSTIPVGTPEVPSLGWLSAELADLVPGLAGPGSSPRPSSANAGGGRRGTTPTVALNGHRLLTAKGGRHLVAVSLTVKPTKRCEVVARAGVAYEGGTDWELTGPVVHGYARASEMTSRSTAEVVAIEGTVLKLEPSAADQDWVVVVSHPEDLALDVEVVAREVPA